MVGWYVMDEVQVPTHFLCPISLQLMRDPVTVSTGITYDRKSIKRWLSSSNTAATCPVTKQALDAAHTLTPNHTLRRLIQGWSTLNASKGIELIPTPKPALEKAQIAKILSDGTKHPHMRLASLQHLRSIAAESERSRMILAGEESGVVEFLVSVITRSLDSASLAEEALHVLHILGTIPESHLKSLTRGEAGDEFISSLVRISKTSGDYQSRARAIASLRSIFKVADPMRLTSVQPEVFQVVIGILADQISQQASKAALKLLVEVCPWGRNRIKAVEGGAVSVLVELLLGAGGRSSGSDDRRSCELMLTVLDQLCGCAEGREELLNHGAGLAVVSKKILRVSHVASDRAVKVLSSVSRFSSSPRVLQEMLQVGAVSKLCLMIQVECGLKTKERAREILKLHSRVWRNSPCIPPHLLSSYPSS